MGFQFVVSYFTDCNGQNWVKIRKLSSSGPVLVNLIRKGPGVTIKWASMIPTLKRLNIQRV